MCGRRGERSDRGAGRKLVQEIEWIPGKVTLAQTGQNERDVLRKKENTTDLT